MCVHTRIIYTCGHYGWGAKDLLDCNLQKAYKQGIWSAECDTMTSHPLKTVKVTQLCTVCVKKKNKTDEVVSTTKAVIAELAAVLTRIKEETAQRARDELEEKEQRDRDRDMDRDRFANLEFVRSVAVEEMIDLVKGDIEEVKIVEDLLARSLRVVPDLESSDDEDMSPIRPGIKKNIREVRKVMGEFESVLEELPDIDNSDESLTPIQSTMSG